MVSRKLMMNIEVKAPHEDQVKCNYNYKRTIRKVHETIVNSGIENHCCVSSFDSDVLAELDLLNKEMSTNVQIIYLYNFYEHEELPDPSVYA